MKLTVLCDNNTIIDRYLLGEPALSFLIEDEGKRILFDTGYSDVLIRNAEALNIDLNTVDALVLSHGHNDHTGGLQYLKHLDCDLYCHPDCLNHKMYQGNDISIPVDLSETQMKIHLSKEPIKLSEHLTYLGEIPRKWQNVKPLEDDHLFDDTALVYDGERGLFVITGCSHSGIVNICQYAMEVTGCRRVYGVIGGLHILDDEALAQYVADYFFQQGIKELYPCHCTDLQAKIILSRRNAVTEVGSGSVIEY